MQSHCISHSKDVDGIASAALVQAVVGGTFKLTDYDGLRRELDSIPPSTEEFILCDLGTDPAGLQSLVAKLKGLSERMTVTYIDHHYLPDDSQLLIRQSGVRLRHNQRECSGVLTYKTFEKGLPQEARLLALYAAVTDYMDNSRIAKKMMERFDRHMVLFESTLLTHAVARLGDDHNFLARLVVELSEMKRPHAIEGIPEAALLQARMMEELSRVVAKRGVRRDNVAYMETDQHSTGSVAKLLLGAFDVRLGVAFREKRGKGWYETSLRGTSDLKIHLGKVVGGIANEYGGKGGGHRVAAGCTIPKNRMNAFLEELNGLLAG